MPIISTTIAVLSAYRLYRQSKRAFTKKGKGKVYEDEEKKKNYDKIIKNIEDLGDLQLKVGIFGSVSKEKHKGDDSGALTIGEIAVKNEYGIDVPERSFIRSTYDENKDDMRERFVDIVKGLKSSPNEARKKLDQLGLYMAGKVKEKITELKEPPNAPATIERKKSSNPLIDTGQMRQSVTWALEKKK